jgi:hypothetical protein
LPVFSGDILKPEIQKALLDKLSTTVPDENWDVFPIAMIIIDKDD